jgi:catechol 2,3-dioxygenase-like lactoylglutathione lyase family enzyme
MPTFSKLSHIALVVRDPSRTAAFLEDLFDTQAVRRHDEDGHDETFLHLGGTWFVLVGADVERPLIGDHVAFHATAEQLRSFAAKLDGMGHDYQMARADTALYFTDFDNHVFELDSTDLGLEAPVGKG